MHCFLRCIKLIRFTDLGDGIFHIVPDTAVLVATTLLIVHVIAYRNIPLSTSSKFVFSFPNGLQYFQACKIPSCQYGDNIYGLTIICFHFSRTELLVFGPCCVPYSKCSQHILCCCTLYNSASIRFNALCLLDSPFV